VKNEKTEQIRSLIFQSVNKNIIKNIYLFDSYSCGKPTKEGDIDICVIIDNNINRKEVFMDISINLIKNRIIEFSLSVYKEEIFNSLKKIDSVDDTIVKEYVTEESFELLEQANADIVVIGDWLGRKEISKKVRYGRACYHATQAVEKMLKGYLRHKEEALIEKIHNLNKLLDISKLKDEKFENILRDCAYLSEYTSAMRYSTKSDIKREDVIEVLYKLKNVYNFEIINNLYNEYDRNKILKMLPQNYIDKIIRKTKK